VIRSERQKNPIQSAGRPQPSAESASNSDVFAGIHRPGPSTTTPPLIGLERLERAADRITQRSLISPLLAREVRIYVAGAPFARGASEFYRRFVVCACQADGACLRGAWDNPRGRRAASFRSPSPMPCPDLPPSDRNTRCGTSFRSGGSSLTTSDDVILIATGILTLSARSRTKPSRVRRDWRVSRVSPSWLRSFPAFPPIRRPSRMVRGERSTTQPQARSSHHAGNDRR